MSHRRMLRSWPNLASDGLHAFAGGSSPGRRRAQAKSELPSRLPLEPEFRHQFHCSLSGTSSRESSLGIVRRNLNQPASRRRIGKPIRARRAKLACHQTEENGGHGGKAVHVIRHLTAKNGVGEESESQSRRGKNVLQALQSTQPGSAAQEKKGGGRQSREEDRTLRLE